MTTTISLTSHSPARLHQPWLTIARAVWVLYVVVIVVSRAAGLPIYYAHLIGPSSPFIGPGWTQATLVEALASLHLSAAVFAGLIVVATLIRVLVFSVVGGLIFWRKSDEWLGLFASYVLIGIGWAIGDTPNWYVHLPHLWQQIVGIPLFFVWPAFFIFLYLYPDGRFTPTWTRYLTALWTILGTFVSAAYVNIEPPGWVTGLALILLALGLLAQIYRYWRIFDAIERLQTRWFLFSVVGLFGSLAAFSYLSTSVPSLQQRGPSYLMSRLSNSVAQDILFLLLPISIGVAIFRYRLWDIDIIIRKTLIYSVVTTILGGVYFGGVIMTQQVVRAFIGQSGGDIGIVLSTMLIAALFNPLRRRIQDIIDRRFYRRKYDAEKTLATFSQSMRDEVDIETLKAQLVGVVNDTMQPDKIALWVATPSKSEKSA